MAAIVDIDALRRYIGKTVEEHDVATAAPLHGMIVTFDRSEPPPQDGDIVQPGWHHAYFLQMPRKAKLAADGLPIDSALLPPMPFPRRMYAGADIAFHEPIRVGDRLRRVSELTDISLREGSTGTLIFVTQTRSIFSPRGLAVVERANRSFARKCRPVRQTLRRDATLPWAIFRGGVRLRSIPSRCSATRR